LIVIKIQIIMSVELSNYNWPGVL